MGIKYKKLTENELDIFIDMRNNQLREEGAKEDIDLVSALKDYYNRHMADGTFISCSLLMKIRLLGQVLITEEKVSQRSCSHVL